MTKSHGLVLTEQFRKTEAQGRKGWENTKSETAILFSKAYHIQPLNCLKRLLVVLIKSCYVV